MEIKLIKIKRHWWCPIIVKEILLRVKPDLPIKNEFVVEGKTKDGEKIESFISVEEKTYIQPLYNDWSIKIKDNKIEEIEANYNQ